MRLGHCGVVACLYIVHKLDIRLCDYREQERVCHVLYRVTRQVLFMLLDDLRISTFSFCASSFVPSKCYGIVCCPSVSPENLSVFQNLVRVVYFFHQVGVATSHLPVNSLP